MDPLFAELLVIIKVVYLVAKLQAFIVIISPLFKGLAHHQATIQGFYCTSFRSPWLIKLISKPIWNCQYKDQVDRYKDQWMAIIIDAPLLQ